MLLKAALAWLLLLGAAQPRRVAKEVIVTMMDPTVLAYRSEPKSAGDRASDDDPPASGDRHRTRQSLIDGDRHEERRYYAGALAAQLVRAAAGAGVTAIPLASSLGVAAGPMPVLQGSIGADATHAAWERFMREVRDPGMPVNAASLAHPEILGVAAFLRATCSDGACILRTLIASQSVLGDGCFWTLDLEGEAVRVQLYSPCSGTLGERCMVEYLLALLVRVVGLASGGACRPDHATFAHPAPESSDAHDGAFGDARFEASCNSVVFERTALQRPLETTVSGLVPASPYAGSSASDRVYAEAVSMLEQGTLPTTPALARRVGVGCRTLQRMLAREGVTVRELVQQAKREAALRLLSAHPSPSVKEVATMLGFGSTAAFSRAFRRWTSECPRQWRRRVRSRSA